MSFSGKSPTFLSGAAILKHKSCWQICTYSEMLRFNCAFASNVNRSVGFVKTSIVAICVRGRGIAGKLYVQTGTNSEPDSELRSERNARSKRTTQTMRFARAPGASIENVSGPRRFDRHQARATCHCRNTFAACLFTSVIRRQVNVGRSGD